MRFQAFIETCFSIMFLSGSCLSDSDAFLSMPGDCRYPAAATEGNSIFLAWLVTEIRPANVYFRRSTDEGKTWNGVKKISNEKGDCMPPSIASNSGIVHLAWVDCGAVIDGELYYTRSLDEGESWESNSILVGNVNSATNPVISSIGSNVYLIWQDQVTRVFFKASRDKGQTWENETLLGKVGKHSCYCFPPSFSVKENELTVVWNALSGTKKSFNVRLFGFSLFKADTTKMTSSVVCRKSADKGRTWSKEHILTSNKVSKEVVKEVDNPTLVSDGSRSYLFWQDKHDLPFGQIYYTGFYPATEKGRIAGMALYPAPKRSPKCPMVVFDNDRNLHLTWTSFSRGKSIVYYGTIDPAGNILKEKKNLTPTAGRYNNPIITRTPSGFLHVFWFNKPEDENESSRIFLKTSTDNGLTWKNRRAQTEDIRQ